jgi:hypothetical protein
MKERRLSQWILVGLLFVLTSCKAAGETLDSAVFESEVQLPDIHLAKGAVDAVPLWTYCSPLQENTLIRTFNCRATVGQTLAVGHLFLLTDAGILNWAAVPLVWGLAIDDQVIDLDSFGMFDYVMPAMPASPSPLREVFARVTDWDLVMTSLSPGEHTLHFRAQNDTAQYHWLVNLVIDGVSQSDISSVPFAPKS